MSKGRDDFPQKVKTALALRAAYKCSVEGCGKSTVGPSDEAPDAVANIGIAAHICAASAGGSRYDTTMTPEQRSGIENGIWTCANHGALIDRDEVSYTVETLRAMKRAHEARCAAEIGNTTKTLGTGELIALGPDLVFVGELIGAAERNWRLRLDHFVIGDLATLTGYISEFSNAARGDRYVLVNSIGEGRVLSGAPTWSRDGDRHAIECPVQPQFPTIPAQRLATDLAMSSKPDLFFENGDIATVEGIDALPQKIWMNLSYQRGDSLFDPDFGTRIGEYYEVLGTSPWFGQLLKLEAIRLAAIPYSDSLDNRQYTAFQCVQRVYAVDVRGEPISGRMPIQVVFQVNGIGRWSHDLDIFLPLKSAGAS